MYPFPKGATYFKKKYPQLRNFHVFVQGPSLVGPPGPMSASHIIPILQGIRKWEWYEWLRVPLLKTIGGP